MNICMYACMHVLKIVCIVPAGGSVLELIISNTELLINLDMVSILVQKTPDSNLS